LPREALYPISFKERRAMLRPDGNAERFLTPDTFSIHFYGRRMRERIKQGGGEPHPNSLIGRLLTKHGVVPSDAPLPKPLAAPPTPVALTPEEKRGRGQVNLTDLADAGGSDRGSDRHRFTELYQMLFLPLRQRKLTIALIGLDGGVGVDLPEQWDEQARISLKMWLDYFPKAEFIALDRAEKAPLTDKRLTYTQVTFNDPGEIATALTDAPDIVIDDATHASHHQQNAIRALFPKLQTGGLYIVEDLRSQPKTLEKQALVKTSALFQGYLDTGVFDHPDEAAKADFNEIRADMSGCFVFQANFQKRRRDQILVLHKR